MTSATDQDKKPGSSIIEQYTTTETSKLKPTECSIHNTAQHQSISPPEAKSNKVQDHNHRTQQIQCTSLMQLTHCTTMQWAVELSSYKQNGTQTRAEEQALMTEDCAKQSRQQQVGKNTDWETYYLLRDWLRCLAGFENDSAQTHIDFFQDGTLQSSIANILNTERGGTQRGNVQS